MLYRHLEISLCYLKTRKAKTTPHSNEAIAVLKDEAYVIHTLYMRMVYLPLHEVVSTMVLWSTHEQGMVWYLVTLEPEFC